MIGNLWNMLLNAYYFVIYVIPPFGIYVYGLTLFWIERSVTNFWSYLLQHEHGQYIVLDLLDDLKYSLVFALKCYSWVFNIRYVMNWFPNINPFVQPFYIIRAITDPIVMFFVNFAPVILGWDFSLVLSMMLVDNVIAKIEAFNVYHYVLIDLATFFGVNTSK